MTKSQGVTCGRGINVFMEVCLSYKEKKNFCTGEPVRGITKTVGGHKILRN